MNGSQFPDLRTLLHEFQPPAEEAPWWVRWDVIPIALCLCIAAAWAFGEWRLS